MGFIDDFKKFAIGGNVFDMAVGIIMGGAFGKIVTSLLENVMNPIIGMLTGKTDFSGMYFALKNGDKIAAGLPYADAKKNLVEAPILGYGQFISDIINFLIMAFVVFLMVKAFNNAKARMMNEKPAAPPAPTKSEALLEDIKNLLARGR